MNNGYVITPSSNDLQHHGILGQKWGKRNGPPYPLTLFNHSKQEKKAGWEKSLSKYSINKDNTKKVLKKGSKIQRIGSQNEINEGRTYVSYTKKDNDRYIVYGIEKVLGGGDTKIEMQSINDINIADANSMFKTFIDMYKDFKLIDFVDASSPEEINRKGKITTNSKKKRNEVLNTFRNAFDSEDNLEKAYAKFNQGLMNKNKISDEYFNRLQKIGFDAMTDLNDKDAADDPLIIFNRAKNLKTIKETKLRDIPQKEIDRLTEEGFL